MPIKYNVEKALKHIKRSNINEANKKHIFEYVNTLSAQGLSKARQVKYIYILKKLSDLYKKDFSNATKKEMEKVCSEINNSDLAKWTMHDYKLTLKRFMRWLRIREIEEYNKTNKKKKEQFIERQYPEEVDWIKPHKDRGKKVLPTELLSMEDVKELADHTENLRDRCLIIFMYESGARIGEIQNIKLKDIDSDKHGVTVDLFGKTGSRRILVIASAPSINNWLLEHPRRKDKNAPLFCGIWGKTRGKELGYRYINKLLRIAAIKAGIDKPVNPHHFRHSRSSELAQTFTESQLCEYLGWKQGSKQASTYVHLSGKNVRDAILKLHGLVKEDDEVKKFSPVTCPRCTSVNDPSAKLCNQCGLGLDERSMIEYDKQKDIAAETGFNIQHLMQNNDFKLQLMNMMAEQLEKMESEKDKK